MRELWVVEEKDNQIGTDWTPWKENAFDSKEVADDACFRLEDDEGTTAPDRIQFRVVRYTPEVPDGD